MSDIPEQFRAESLMRAYLKTVSPAYIALQSMLTPDGQRHIKVIFDWVRTVFVAIGQYSSRINELEAQVRALEAENAGLRQLATELRQENGVLEEVLGVKLKLEGGKE